MSSPQVGDVLTTPEQLNACPTGTIVRSNLQVVAVAEDAGQVRPWAVVGDTSMRESGDLLIRGGWGTEWEVIWVPPITRVEVTTDTWIIDNGEAIFPRVPPELLDLVRSVPVGGRVRVTVEKIGDDDAT